MAVPRGGIRECHVEPLSAPRARRMFLAMMGVFGFFLLRHQTVETNYVIANSMTLFVLFMYYNASE